MRSRTEMRWTELIRGEPYSNGVDQLSPDARTLRETSWLVTRPAEKQRAVYRKL